MNEAKLILPNEVLLHGIQIKDMELRSRMEEMRQCNKSEETFWLILLSGWTPCNFSSFLPTTLPFEYTWLK
jgi:hypothetical protein